MSSKNASTVLLIWECVFFSSFLLSSRRLPKCGLYYVNFYSAHLFIYSVCCDSVEAIAFLFPSSFIRRCYRIIVILMLPIYFFAVAQSILSFFLSTNTSRPILKIWFYIHFYRCIIITFNHEKCVVLSEFHESPMSWNCMQTLAKTSTYPNIFPVCCCCCCGCCRFFSFHVQSACHLKCNPAAFLPKSLRCTIAVVLMFIHINLSLSCAWNGI